MLIRDTKKLDENTYYHCITNNHDRNEWLCKGNRAIIFLSNFLGSNANYSETVYDKSSGIGTIANVTEGWEVREATMEERTWIIQCMYERKLVPRPMDGIVIAEGVYQIY